MIAVTVLLVISGYSYFNLNGERIKMASRNLLHRDKLEDFKAWLEANYGWITLPTKGAYEVLRWSDGRYGESMKIIFSGKSPQHLSCNEASIPYVKRFIRETK
ncbi:hypothetical protein NVP1173O_27 [Vibrio phage 1.173.O._10N.261.55.A11]|nr:hypothetical protein NVP1173O_27 [Vibrio phage 1.173.O._10N.261.55.A11]